MPSLTSLAGGRPPRCFVDADGRPEADAGVDIVITVRSRNDSRGLGWVNRQAWWAPPHRLRLSRSQCLQVHGASERDLEAVRASLSSWGIGYAVEDSADRLVHASASVALMERAFGVSLISHSGHRGRDAAIELPPRLVGVAGAVTGLDSCTLLRPFVEMVSSRRATATRGHIERVWGLPPDLRGEGTCVAVTAPVELDVAELIAAGLPPGVAVLGASPGRTAPRAWIDAVVAQVVAVGVAAPGARVVVHAGRGGESGAIETMAAAVHDPVHAPQVVVAGWGAPEEEWSPQAMLAIEQRLLAAAAMGVTVVCGAPPGAAVFPASGPHALACAQPAGGSRPAVTVASRVFPAPAWTGLASDAGRAVPDVLAPGAVRTPSGQVAAGAGIAAALTAGGIAALGEAPGAPLGYVHPLLLGERGAGRPAEPDLAGFLLRCESAVPPPAAQISADHRAHPPAILVRRGG